MDNVGTIVFSVTAGVLLTLLASWIPCVVEPEEVDDKDMPLDDRWIRCVGRVIGMAVLGGRKGWSESARLDVVVWDVGMLEVRS